ncbi:hypothetical protein CR513_10794, partial [Mucuna pruriens]
MKDVTHVMSQTCPSNPNPLNVSLKNWQTCCLHRLVVLYIHAMSELANYYRDSKCSKVTMLTKKTILGVFKSIPFYASSRLSTAYERAEGSNAVAKGSSDDGVVKREDMGMSNDPAKDGPIKAVEDADMVRDTAKESMDGAWIAAQQNSHKRIPIVVSYNNLVKHLQHSTTPKAAIVSTSSNRLCISDANARVHTQGGDSIVEAATEGAVKATEAVLENVGEKAKGTVDTALDAAKKSAELVTETTMAEADTNIVDTAEYRCSQDMGGQLGDGHDGYN